MNTPVRETPYCINCNHVATNGYKEVATYRCFAPENESRVNLVSGEKEYLTPYCASHRAIDTSGQVSNKFCTRDGYWFKEKVVTIKEIDSDTDIGANKRASTPRAPRVQLTADDL